MTSDGEAMAEAHFTKDMAETLVRFFQAYAECGVVTVEVKDGGLWLVNPNDRSRQFLGKAVLREGEKLFARARRGIN